MEKMRFCLPAHCELLSRQKGNSNRIRLTFLVPCLSSFPLHKASTSWVQSHAKEHALRMMQGTFPL
jgi:hypothetical protein